MNNIKDNSRGVVIGPIKEEDWGLLRSLKETFTYYQKVGKAKHQDHINDLKKVYIYTIREYVH